MDCSTTKKRERERSDRRLETTAISEASHNVLFINTRTIKVFKLKRSRCEGYVSDSVKRNHTGKISTGKPPWKALRGNLWYR